MKSSEISGIPRKNKVIKIAFKAANLRVLGRYMCGCVSTGVYLFVYLFIEAGLPCSSSCPEA